MKLLQILLFERLLGLALRVAPKAHPLSLPLARMIDEHAGDWLEHIHKRPRG